MTQFLKGTVIRQSWIKRADLRANPDVLYLFGDNAMRYGMGGQAGEMRGEPNAVGIATKWDIKGKASDYFSDDNFEGCTAQIRADYDPVYRFLQQPGSIVVVPMDGLGTGLSELPERAPRVYRYLCGLGLGAKAPISDREIELRAKVREAISEAR